MEEKFYQFRIKLIEIEPEIWRRFVVPAGITLDRLHDVIQIVMGWRDYHLHQFSIGNTDYVEDPEEFEFGENEGLARLEDLIKRKNQKFLYVYDFGDNWEHELVLENSRFDVAQLAQDLQCISGERACPPEDVGSVPGYYDFCEAAMDPNHEEHEDVNHWYEELYPESESGFDSEWFDLDMVNIELAKYQRWSRDRQLPWRS